MMVNRNHINETKRCGDSQSRKSKKQWESNKNPPNNSHSESNNTGPPLDFGNEILCTLTKAINSHDIEDFKAIFHSYLSPSLEVTSQLFGKIDPKSGRPQNIYANQTGEEMKTKLCNLQEFYDFYERCNVVIPDGYLRTSHVLHSHVTKNNHLVLQCKFLYRGTFLTYPNGKDVGHSMIEDETTSLGYVLSGSGSMDIDSNSTFLKGIASSTTVEQTKISKQNNQSLHNPNNGEKRSNTLPTISLSTSVIPITRHHATSADEEEVANCLLIMTTATNRSVKRKREDEKEMTKQHGKNTSMLVFGEEELPDAAVISSSTVSDIGIIGEKSFKAIGSFSIRVDLQTRLIDKIDAFYEHHF